MYLAKIAAGIQEYEAEIGMTVTEMWFKHVIFNLWFRPSKISSNSCSVRLKDKRVEREKTATVGLIPEQVWDSDDIPERELFRGKASGSAMPLVWAHAEHVKLLRSLKDGRVFDMPPEPVQR